MVIIMKPQYYAALDPAGNIAGFYVDAIHGDNIPETAIPITAEQWQTYAAAPHLYKLDNGVIREKTPEEIEAERAQRTPAPKSRVELLEEENALLTLELAQTQLRLDQAEQEQAALLLELVNKGVL
jgi:hypothetical protein